MPLMFYYCLQEVSSIHLPQKHPAEKGKFTLDTPQTGTSSMGCDGVYQPTTSLSHNVS